MLKNFQITWQTKLEFLDRFLLLSGAAAALLFTVTDLYTGFEGDEYVKALPVVFLGLLALKYVPGWRGIILLIALLCGAWGDIVLERSLSDNFLLGVKFFTINQILYILLLLPEFKYNRNLLQPALLLGGVGLFITIYLFPELGNEWLNILIYSGAIMLMSYLALFHHKMSQTLFIGALCFLLSDTLVGMNRYIESSLIARLLIMPTYYLAQFLLAGSYIFYYARLKEDLD